MYIVAPLTHCKTPTCREPIGVQHVVKEKIVTESEGHVVVVYKCPNCARTDRMVGTVESWQDFVKEAKAEDLDIEAHMRAASIELDAIHDVNELATLWRSLKKPPRLEDVMGACKCATCKARDEI